MPEGRLESLPTPAPASSTDSRWLLLHTRARQEKAVAGSLEAIGVEGYLPLVSVRRRYGHRKRETMAPLFPSYVFARCPVEATWRVQDCGRVAQVLEIVDQGRFNREIEQIRLAIEADVRLDPHPFLKTGTRVRVRAGPLRGVEGIVEITRKVDRLVLQIHTLGQAASVEIDAAEVETLD